MDEKLDARGRTLAQVIADHNSGRYPRPAVTADVVLLRKTGERYQVLLIERGGHPCLGKLAFPGGFANENEPLEQTATRELQEETGVTGLGVELIGVFSKPGRDPRGWIVTAAYTAMIGDEPLYVQAGDDAASAQWYDLERGACGPVLCRLGQRTPARELAFDHGDMLLNALEKWNIVL